MAGKRANAERISQWLGSCGEIGFPPIEYFEIEAAQILGMSYVDLTEHPAQAQLMASAFAYQRGKAEGEYLRELNPDWVKKRKAAQKAFEKLNK